MVGVSGGGICFFFGEGVSVLGLGSCFVDRVVVILLLSFSVGLVVW